MKNLWNTSLLKLVDLGLKQRKTKNLAEQVAKSTRKEFVQLDPQHWLQAGEDSKLCLRHEHRMVLHPNLKLHLTMCRRLSGVGGKSVITGNT